MTGLMPGTPACSTSTDNMYSGMLEASGEAVEEWLQSSIFEEQLFCFFPCTDITPSLANKVCTAQTLQCSSVPHSRPPYTSGIVQGTHDIAFPCTC